MASANRYAIAFTPRTRPVKYLLAMGIILALLLTVVVGSSDSHSMVYIEDLRHEARVASENKLVLLIEFSASDCPYCFELEEDFLLPMQRNAGYGKKVLIRSVSIDDYETIIDFDGRSISTYEFALRYDVMVTPTMVFLDSRGRQLSEKLVGIWSKDYFGAFIDERIDEARQKL